MTGEPEDHRDKLPPWRIVRQVPGDDQAAELCGGAHTPEQAGVLLAALVAAGHTGTFAIEGPWLPDPGIPVKQDVPLRTAAFVRVPERQQVPPWPTPEPPRPKGDRIETMAGTWTLDKKTGEYVPELPG